MALGSEFEAREALRLVLVVPIEGRLGFVKPQYLFGGAVMSPGARTARARL